MKGPITSLSSRTLIVLSTIILIFALPVLIFSVQLVQDFRQHASGSLADITVDFGNRQNKSFPIPNNFFGINGLGPNKGIPEDTTSLSQAKIGLTRIGNYMGFVFRNPQSLTDDTKRDWSQVDQDLTLVNNDGLQPIIVLSFSPVWMEPAKQNPPLLNPCQNGEDPSHVKPSYVVNGQDIGLQTWGKLAAILVNHIDKAFPSLHPYYEIWNEPDGTGFWCENPPTGTTADATRLSDYKALYAAAAPLIKQQAASDGVAVRVGGPVLGFSTARAATWIPSFVDDPTVAPYIDFVSFHHYRSSTSWPALVAATQETTVSGINGGYTALYQLVANAVSQGKQPNAASTPILMDEYNTGSSIQNFGNTLPYAPLWNSLVVTDILNSAISPQGQYSNANVLPSLSYFAYAKLTPQGNTLCMFGVYNTQMDCSLTGGTVQPYPQYYTYLLFGGANYLNITDNGYVANSAASNLPGVYTTGFFTKKQDTLVMVNTTATDYPAITVAAQNVGFVTASTGTLFTLNQTNPKINVQTIPLGANSTNTSTVLHLPPYSTVALTFSAQSPLTPTPSSPTPTPSSETSLLFAIGLHGIGNGGTNANPQAKGTTTPKHQTRPITVTAINMQSNKVSTASGTLTFDSTQGIFTGTASFANLISGDYLMKVKTDGFLEKQGASIVHVIAKQSNSVPPLYLTNGDINNDNQISILDYNIIAECYGTKLTTDSCPVQYRPNSTSSGADIDDDNGQIDGPDYNLLLVEWSVQSGQ